MLGGACSRAAPELILPVSNWPGYEYFYLAELNDLAAAEGLRLRTAEFPDPQAIVHAFLRGELQLAQLTTVEAVDICSRAPDRCPVVVLILDESRGGDKVYMGVAGSDFEVFDAQLKRLKTVELDGEIVGRIHVIDG